MFSCFSIMSLYFCKNWTKPKIWREFISLEHRCSTLYHKMPTSLDSNANYRLIFKFILFITPISRSQYQHQKYRGRQRKILNYATMCFSQLFCHVNIFWITIIQIPNTCILIVQKTFDFKSKMTAHMSIKRKFYIYLQKIMIPCKPQT